MIKTFFFHTARGVSHQIGQFSRRCCNETIALAEKCEQTLRSTHFSMKEHGIGESYYRLALLNLKHLKVGTEASQLESAKLVIKSILRGMRCESKNARLQFTRLFHLSNINTEELTAIFNAEVNIDMKLKCLNISFTF